MKRSEMIKLIEDKLDYLVLSENPYAIDGVAEVILDICEENGMLPPERVCNIHNPPTLYPCTHNEWEPE